MVHINSSESSHTQILGEFFLGPRPFRTVGKFDQKLKILIKQLLWHVDTLFLCFLGRGIT